MKKMQVELQASVAMNATTYLNVEVPDDMTPEQLEEYLVQKLNDEQFESDLTYETSWQDENGYDLDSHQLSQGSVLVAEAKEVDANSEDYPTNLGVLKTEDGLEPVWPVESESEVL